MIDCSTGFLPIKYGTFDFSTVPLKASTNVTPVMSEDGITIKYYETTFQVEFILSNDNGTDTDMDTIKSQLLLRGQKFEFANRGFGSTVTLNAPGSTFADINYGPIPKILSWKPLGVNLSVQVSWELVAKTLACPVDSDLSVTNAEQFTILSFIEESKISFDEDGAATISTSGSIEVAGFTGGQLTPDKLKKFAALFDKNKLLNFQRTSEITLRKDLRTIDYTITDVEIKSDNAFHPYMVSQDVSHEISSTLLSDNVYEGAGFITWGNSMVGDFTVKPGVWKGWAWIAFSIYLANRRNRSAAFGAPLDRFAKDDQTQNAKKKIQPKQIPLSLRIKESLNSRKVSVSVRWVVHTSLFNLFKSTGMFYPVDTQWTGVTNGTIPPDISVANPTSLDNQWSYWKATVTDIQTRTGFRNPTASPLQLIFDVCSTNQTTLATNRASIQSQASNTNQFRPSSSNTYERDSLILGNGSYDSAATSEYLDGITPENSWITYKPTFELLEETNSHYLPTIECQNLSSRKAANLTSTAKDQSGFRINGISSTPSQYEYAADILQIRGKPIYKVRMKGYAMRVGYQIPTPVLMQANSLDCYRIGNNKWSHRQIGVSDQVPVYLAMWDNLYAILGDPSGSDIQFNTSARGSEFV